MLTENQSAILQHISEYLPGRIRSALLKMLPDLFSSLEEIRLKAGLPLMGVFNGYDRFINEDGNLSITGVGALDVTVQELEELFYRMCEHSVYAYQEDIIRGFITLKGGHRAGICGTVVYQGHSVRTIKDISSVCIRISRQLKGCAREFFIHIQRNHEDIYNTLIISPPRCGKTTLLRDLCRIISEGCRDTGFIGLRTAVIDERSELAACYKGIPQNDLGPRTDVMNSCRKPEGIEMMLRGMSPSVILVDELGASEDAEAIKSAWNAGVRIIATAHAYDVEDFRARLGIGRLAGADGFERYIVLTIDQGKRKVRVMDKNGNKLFSYDEAGRVADGIRRVYGDRYEAVGKTQGEAACTHEA